jgi:hypothetical protein
MGIVIDYVADFPAEAQRGILGENARRFYGV